MEQTFDEYIERNNRRLIDIISSPAMDSDGKIAMMNYFFSTLYDNICEINSAKDLDDFYVEVSIKSIDKELSDSFSTGEINHEKIESLFTEQEYNFAYYEKKGKELPELVYSSVEQSQKVYIKIVENQVVDFINQLNDLLNQGDKLDTKKCSSIILMIEKLESVLKKQKREMSDLLSSGKLAELRAEFEAKVSELKKHNDTKKQLEAEVVENAKKLNEYVTKWYKLDEKNLLLEENNIIRDVMALIEKQKKTFAEYENNNGELPQSYTKRLSDITEEFNLYSSMLKIDAQLSKETDSNDCTNLDLQINNIKECKSKKWRAPALLNKDLISLKEERNRQNVVQSTKTTEKKTNSTSRSKTKKKEKEKNDTTFGAFIVILSFFAIGTALFLSYFYEAKLPSEVFICEKYDYLSMESFLEDSGFTNVSKVKVSDGYYEEGKVVRISINGKYDYSADNSYEKDAPVLIEYSCGDRTDISNVLVNWETRNYLIQKQLFEANGYENITLNPVLTTEPEEHNKIESFVFNGEKYYSGECYIVDDANITINYYACQCKVGKSSANCIGTSYEDLVQKLQEQGFVNITLKRSDDLITGWISSEGNVKSITVDGKTKFSGNDLFDYNAKIDIVVYTFRGKGYDDITIIDK